MMLNPRGALGNSGRDRRTGARHLIGGRRSRGQTEICGTKPISRKLHRNSRLLAADVDLLRPEKSKPVFALSSGQASHSMYRRWNDPDDRKNNGVVPNVRTPADGSGSRMSPPSHRVMANHVAPDWKLAHRTRKSVPRESQK